MLLLMSVSELDSLKSLLDQPMRVKLTDGRIIEGAFQCADKNLNFILANATEYYGAEDVNFAEGDVKNSRAVGMVVIPGQHIISCCVEKQDS